jgi:hypothetical protein
MVFCLVLKLEISYNIILKDFGFSFSGGFYIIWIPINITKPPPTLTSIFHFRVSKITISVHAHGVCP